VTQKRKKIVLLDDSDLIRELVRETLEEHGYEVVEASTPFGFSNLLRKEQPDLALLDVTMPNLPGDKLAQIAIKHGATCPIVLFSDRPVDELAAMAKEAKVAGFISKTSDIKAVVHSLERFFR
jgi:DNA-binding response OmpR family regulator